MSISREEMMSGQIDQQSGQLKLLEERIKALEQGYCYYNAEQIRLKKLTFAEHVSECLKHAKKEYDRRVASGETEDYFKDVLIMKKP